MAEMLAPMMTNYARESATICVSGWKVTLSGKGYVISGFRGAQREKNL